MIGVPSLSIQTLTTVGTVLAEAIVLYVGYGALTSLVEPRLTAIIENQ
jgi:hypothetical protein